MAIKPGTETLEARTLLAAPVLTVTGKDLSITSNKSFSEQVAAFSTSITSEKAKNFKAVIDWGDGSTTAGIIKAGHGKGDFTVTGKHDYKYALSMEAATVTITGPDGATGTASVNMTVGHPGVSGVSVPTIQAYKGFPLSGVIVGEFDINQAGRQKVTASDFSVVATPQLSSLPAIVAFSDARIVADPSVANRFDIVVDSFESRYITADHNSSDPSPGPAYVTSIVTWNHLYHTTTQFSIKTPVNVTAKPIVQTGSPVTLSFIQYQIANVAVGYFKDPNPLATVATFTAKVLEYNEQGVQTNTPVTTIKITSVDSSGVTFGVFASLVALDGDAYDTVMVTAKDTTQELALENAKVIVTSGINLQANPLPTGLVGQPIADPNVSDPIDGTMGDARVAFFSSASSTANLQSFHCEVIWGDNDVTTDPRVTQGAIGFTIYANHTYNAAGQFHVIIEVYDSKQNLLAQVSETETVVSS